MSIDTIPWDFGTTATIQPNTFAISAIDYFGDLDLWRTQLVFGYQYSIAVAGASLGIGTLLNPLLSIYGPNFALVASNDDVVFPLVLDSLVNLTPGSTGTYYLGVSAVSLLDFGSYRLSVDRDELSNTNSAATALVNGMTAGQLSTTSDISDWYGINLTAGVQYQIDLIGANTNSGGSTSTMTDPRLYLREANGTFIRWDDDSGIGTDARIYFTPTATGKYFLDVQRLSYLTGGSYQLLVNAAPVSGAMSLGAARSEEIQFAGDVDSFSVSLTAGKTYGFRVNGGSLIDPFMEILGSTGQNLRWDDNSGDGLNAFLSFTPTTSGTYYLSVRASGYTATGAYSARVWELPSVSITTASLAEGQQGTSDMVFNVTLSAASPESVSVSLETVGGQTAIAGQDYQARSATLTFAPGQTQAQFRVPIIGDRLFESSEVFSVRLQSASGATLGNREANGFIHDDDAPYALPSDSQARFQWHLYPQTGVNVFPVWKEYTGRGVKVAVFDQGIQDTHHDLDQNVLTALGRDASNLAFGGRPVLSTDTHGTAVAGTIAAELNGFGAVGVAPAASLVSIYSPLSWNSIVSAIPNAFSYARNVDVLNNSWGFAGVFASNITWAFYDDFRNPLFSAAGVELTRLATEGRNGLGTVVVQSAGNHFSIGDDTNLHNFQNSQYIITVGATDFSGNSSSFSSPGASILVSAPGGGGARSYGSVLTTDLLGAAGYVSSDYTLIDGTSFSAPIVSAVVALMLEANPRLGYRDVQEILAYSARITGQTQNEWRYNGAGNWNGGGLHYDAVLHDLGFGLVDARAAVRLAETWTETAQTAANRQQHSVTRTPNALIPDDDVNGVADSFEINQALDIERIEVTLDIQHTFIGDLFILLRSPSGTVSVLLHRPQAGELSAFGSSQDDINFTFTTVLNWGESTVGTWSLAVCDVEAGDTGRLESWTLNFVGKSPSDDDVYIYTDEFSESVTVSSARATLRDLAGRDTLNAAAVSSDSSIDLSGVTPSLIDGRALQIAQGTLLENAIGGDGNDFLAGNTAANWLRGMRGADTLLGGTGSDTLEGGAGADVHIVSANVGISSDSSRVVISGQNNDVGQDVIKGFEFTHDTLLIRALNVRQFSHGVDTAIGISGADTAGRQTSFTTATGLVELNQTVNDNWSDAGDIVVSFSGLQTALREIDFESRLQYELSGTSSADSISGGVLADVLRGLAGSDRLDGGAGADTLMGGLGDDTYIVHDGTDVVIETDVGLSGGRDMVMSYVGHPSGQFYTLASNVENGRIGTAGTSNLAGNDQDNLLYAGIGNNLLNGGGGVDTVSYLFGARPSTGVTVSLAQTGLQETGGSGRDQLTQIENLVGTAFGDVLTGSAGANNLSGDAGNDVIDGGGGDDTLIGGEGRDELRGGEGRDLFDFNLFTEPGNNLQTCDRILDFARGIDRIDLSTLDANMLTTVNDPFSSRLLGVNSAFTAPGQLRFASGVLYGNTDADADSEFMIELVGITTLSPADIVL